VDGQVDVAPEERLLDLLDEDPFSADPGQRDVLQDVPFRPDGDKLYDNPRMALPNPVRDPPGLRQRQGASPRSDPDRL
jgi:hypothetical protein